MAKVRLGILAIVLLLAAGHAEAAAFYVALNGTTAGDGSIDNPWDIVTAFQNTNGTIRPGDTIYIRGGRYYSGRSPSVSGNATHRVTVRSAPGEWAIFDGGYPNATYKHINTLTITGANTIYRDLEITNTEIGNRLLTQLYADNSNPTIGRGSGILVQAANVTLINILLHDTGSGLTSYNAAPDTEAYGLVIWNNGWDAPDRLHGHGIYMHNQYGNKTLEDSIVGDNFGLTMRFGGSDTAYVNNMTAHGNALYGGQVTFGTSRVTDSRFTSNYALPAVQFGYDQNNNNNILIRDNYLMGGLIILRFQQIRAYNNTVWGPLDQVSVSVSSSNATASSFENNTYYNPHTNKYPYWNFNWNGQMGFNKTGKQLTAYTYTGNRSWQDDLGLDNSSTLIEGPPTSNAVFVRPNKYDADRAHVIIYNYQNLSTVAVDISTLGWPNGSGYELRNSQDYFGDVLRNTTNGTHILVPMTDHSVAVPYGYDPELSWNYYTPGSSTFPDYGAFILIRKENATAPTLPANSPPVVEAGQNVALQWPNRTITLNGTASDDGEYQQLMTAWHKISGPGAVGFTNPSTGNTTANFSLPGNYTLRFSAWDGNSTVKDYINVSITSVATAAPYLEYLFDESSGQIISDSSGNGIAGVRGANTSIEQSDPIWQTGQSGTALEFDGADDFALAGNSPGFDDLSAFSISAWVYPYDFAGEPYIVDKGDGRKQFLLAWNGTGKLGGLVRHTTSPASSQASAALPLQQWSHVAMTYNDTDRMVRLFVNGTQVTYTTQTAGSGTPQSDAGTGRGQWMFGSRNGSTSFFNGTIDDVRIYSSTLTPEEIAALAQQPAADSTPPSVPGNMTAVALSNSTIFISWNASTDDVGVAGYRVRRNGTIINTTAATTYTDSNLAASTTYNYTVQAFDAAGNNGTESATAVATTNATVLPDVTPPMITLVSAASITNTTARITWSTDENSTSQVEYGLTMSYGANTTLNLTLATSHAVVLTGLAPNTTYQFRVRSADADSNTNASANSNFTTLATNQPPAVDAGPDQTIALPANATLAGNVSDDGLPSGTLTLNWTLLSGPGTVTFVNSSRADTTASFGANGTYVLRLNASDSALSSSDTVTITVQPASDTTPPSMPTNLTAAALNTTAVRLAWNASTDNVGVVGYRVYRNSTLAGSAAGTWYVDLGLLSNTTYNYTVRAYDAAGQNSTPSDTAVITTPEDIDTDNDGVVNALDRCPATPPSVTVGRFGCRLPSYGNFSPELTTNLSDADLTDVAGFTIGKSSLGSIDFSAHRIMLVNGSNETTVDLDSIIRFSQRRVFVNSTAFGRLNLTANVTVYNLSNLTNPRILVDGGTCSSCRIVAYSNLSNTSANNVTFSVPHFSEYSVEEGSTCGDSYCSTTETCNACSADCGACPSTGTTSGSSGGGGGGGGYVPLRNATRQNTTNSTVLPAAVTPQTTPQMEAIGNATAQQEPGLAEAPDASNGTEAPQETSTIKPPQRRWKTILGVGVGVLAVLALSGAFVIRRARKSAEEQPSTAELAQAPDDDLHSIQDPAASEPKLCRPPVLTPELMSYVETMRSLGKKEDEIAQRLKTAGWEQDCIEAALKK